MPDFLSDLEVVELPGIPSVAFCGKLFADLGASVTKVDFGDRPAGVSEASRAAFSIFVDRSKGRRTIDLGDAAAIKSLRALMVDADFALASGFPIETSAFLGRQGSAVNPRLILAAITDFGLDGPYAGYRASSMVDFAASGYQYQYGSPDRAPLRGLEFHPYFQAGLHAFLGCLAALHERRRSGRGQVVTSSVMQTLASIHEWTTVRYTHGGIIQRRAGNRYPLYHPFCVYPAKDGHISLACHDQQRAFVLLALAGHAEAVGDSRFDTDVSRSIHQAEFDAMVMPWLASKTIDELVEEFEAVQLVAGAVRGVPDLMADADFGGPGFWEDVEVDGRAVRVPGPGLRVLAEAPDNAAASAPPARTSTGGGALAGLRVLDLTRHWAGPHGVRPLGDFGADVIRIEAPSLRGTVPPDDDLVRESGFYIDNTPTEKYWMTSGAYNTFNYNKRCVALRLDRPEGVAVLKRLIEQADIVIDNYATRTWEQFGLNPEAILTANPRVVALTMSGHGRLGPRRNRGAFGPQTEALVGVNSLIGYEGGEPHMSGIAWADPVAGMYAASWALAGLWQRERTGRGLALESAQVEAVATYIGVEITRYGLTGHVPERLGNHHEEYAPHSVYRCAGDDRWVAVAVTGDAEWKALCAAIGRPELDTADTRSASGRRSRQSVIDPAIEAWTATRSPREAMTALQAAGVPAFALYDGRDMVEEHYFWETGVLAKVEGETLAAFVAQLSRTPAAVYRGVADVGEHNREVLREAGFADAEIEALKAADVLVDRPKG